MSLFDKPCPNFKSCSGHRVTKAPYCKPCTKRINARYKAKRKIAWEATKEDMQNFSFGTSHERARVAVLAVKDLMRVVKHINPEMYENYKYLLVKGMEQ